MIKYIVWVGGVADYEGNNKTEATEVLKLWQRLGYDDVTLEELT